MDGDNLKQKMDVLHKFTDVLCDPVLFSHGDILKLVFAATGQRSLRGTELTINYLKKANETMRNGVFERKYIVFHTCFN